VFDQTYTRFLDLQKAEEQAREAQIQLALERVRARTMAMQHSDEHTDAAMLMFKQLEELGVNAFACGFVILDKNDTEGEFWMSSEGVFQPPHYIPNMEEPSVRNMYMHWKNGEESYAEDVGGEALKSHYRYLISLPKSGSNFQGLLDAGITFPEWQRMYAAYFSHGYLLIITKEQYKEEAIFIRFAKVFEQTYTRFLDLQKAEAQARESQIQLALERVRARTMAMQKSEELREVVAVIYEQLQQLGFVQEGSCNINIMDASTGNVDWWMTGFGNQKYPHRYHVEYINHPMHITQLAVWKSGKKYTTIEVAGESKKEFDKLMLSQADFEKMSGETKTMIASLDRVIFSMAFMKYGALSWAANPINDEQANILQRFATVFEQTYTRFLDLQKAEAQGREAQIEAALERVRSRSLAMHRSDELQDVVHTVFEKLKELHVDFYTVIIVIFQEGSKDIIWWMENKVNQQYSKVLVRYADNPYLKDLFEAKQSGIDLFSKSYFGQEKNEFYNYLLQHTDLKHVAEEQKRFLLENEFATMSVAFAKNTGIHITSYSKTSFTEEENEVLKRFANVFDQAYTRFIDLQKSEAQAREAQIEAALERVRSRTLAMQKSEELAETASVLFKQLIDLGIEPNRLYINITKDETGEAEFWITDEDGGKISMMYSVNMNDNPSFKKMHTGWKAQNKSLIIDMGGKELQGYFKYLSSLHVPFKGGLSQKRRWQYIAYFSKGFIGMASPEEQPTETMQLLERFAAVFNLTFTRFNDLKIAEAHALQAEQDLVEIKAAKKKAEDTLTELQATQKQLVQAEKMASLGELTAGIAHEIQNPLNFVNNFSDVSNELLEEMKTELEKGNTEDAIAIVSDVKQNLEKILYHGRRADGIVKGMLQHSRTSSGQKELTDINALADEYLRLAFHGLRAKDKSFNAKFDTDFDKNVDKVNIIPQEIGRVILNLINNAFYAVSQRQRSEGRQYEPTVSVTTKKIADKVEIIVKDNGTGIPQKVLDKIFQPFFTTKPTGQGTGLGLSLAYDIITKGHNGEIKFETQEGEGSKFIIIIPSTQ
jgi:signal transduction histidine kinase